MGWLVAVGVGFTAVGLCLLVWCIFTVARAKSQGLDEDAMRARVQKAVIWNLVAMGLSGLGLMMLIVGLVL